jgi:hypothetical protein
MDWVESGVFCGIRADGCACNNGYNNEERCFLRGPCRGIISGTKLELSVLWDIHQTVRTLGVGIVRIRYQETTSENRKLYVCCS